MDDHKIIMDSDDLFIRLCFYIALWAQLFSRYCWLRSFSRNIVYTGAAQRDVHLASLRTQESAFVFWKDSLHRLDMSRLGHVFLRKKEMAVRGLKLFFALCRLFYFSKTKLQTIPFIIDIANVVLNVLPYILPPFFFYVWVRNIEIEMTSVGSRRNMVRYKKKRRLS